MEGKERIEEAIFSAIETYNSNADDDARIETDLNTVLIGPDATLDSLGLINLTLAVEESVNESFYSDISLTDEDLIGDESGPFQTLRTLADYISTLLNG